MVRGTTTLPSVAGSGIVLRSGVLLLMWKLEQPDTELLRDEVRLYRHDPVERLVVVHEQIVEPLVIDVQCGSVAPVGYGHSQVVQLCNDTHVNVAPVVSAFKLNVQVLVDAADHVVAIFSP